MNIAKILKNASIGTKLYSPMFGDVFLVLVSGDFISVHPGNPNCTHGFNKEGKFSEYGECMLFPSRENRDWSTFCDFEFKEGDFLISGAGFPFILKEITNDSCTIYCGISCRGTIHKHSINWTDITKARRATYKEIKAFLDRLAEEGYIWHSSTLTLKNVRKFDINSLKPFDRVLVRDDDRDIWTCGIYSHLYNGSGYRYICTDGGYDQCIPYTEKTKHLIGTKEDCPEFYKNW